MDDRALIDQAIAAGMVRKIPAGATARELKPKAQQRTRFHPKMCGSGEQRRALPHLDQLDNDWS